MKMFSSRENASNVVRAPRVAAAPRVLSSPASEAALAAEARAARDAEVKAAFEKGRATGRADATRELGGRLSAAVAKLESESVALLDARSEFLKGAEKEVVDLTLVLAQKVLGRAVAELGDTAMRTLREVLHQVTERREVAIRVAPESIETFRAVSSELGSLVSATSPVRWIPDRRVKPTGVIVQTEAGKIDARIETQLEEAAALFDEVWRGRGA
jgi:flagellar biosynthesis/type III secretory pathway protein FliH